MKGFKFLTQTILTLKALAGINRIKNLELSRTLKSTVTSFFLYDVTTFFFRSTVVYEPEIVVSRSVRLNGKE